MEDELIELLKAKRQKLNEDIRYSRHVMTAEQQNALNAINGLIYALQGNDY